MQKLVQKKPPIMDKGLRFNLVLTPMFQFTLPRCKTVKLFKVYFQVNGSPHENLAVTVPLL